MTDVLITTAISYPNSDPRIGNTYESILADFYCNIYLLKQTNIKLYTGTDERGKKSTESKNVTPLELCVANYLKFRNMLSSSGISSVLFIRTQNKQYYHKD